MGFYNKRRGRSGRPASWAQGDGAGSRQGGLRRRGSGVIEASTCSIFDLSACGFGLLVHGASTTSACCPGNRKKHLWPKAVREGSSLGEHMVAGPSHSNARTLLIWVCEHVLSLTGYARLKLYQRRLASLYRRRTLSLCPGALERNERNETVLGLVRIDFLLAFWPQCQGTDELSIGTNVTTRRYSAACTSRAGRTRTLPDARVALGTSCFRGFLSHCTASSSRKPFLPLPLPRHRLSSISSRLLLSRRRTAHLAPFLTSAVLSLVHPTSARSARPGPLLSIASSLSLGPASAINPQR